MNEIVSSDSWLVFTKFHHFIDQLTHFVCYLMFEYKIAGQKIIKAHSITEVFLVSAFHLTLRYLKLNRNGDARGKAWEYPLWDDIRHLCSKNFHSKHVFVYQLQFIKIKQELTLSYWSRSKLFCSSTLSSEVIRESIFETWILRSLVINLNLLEARLWLFPIFKILFNF